MKLKLKAPFESGVAGLFPIREGICLVDTQKQADELCKPPHNFAFIEAVDENAIAQPEVITEQTSTEEESAAPEASTNSEDAAEVTSENETLKKRKRGK